NRNCRSVCCAPLASSRNRSSGPRASCSASWPGACRARAGTRTDRAADRAERPCTIGREMPARVLFLPHHFREPTDKGGLRSWHIVNALEKTGPVAVVVPGVDTL